MRCLGCAALIFAAQLQAAAIDVQSGKHLAGTALVLRLSSDRPLRDATLSGFQQEAAFYLTEADQNRRYAMLAIPLEARSGAYTLHARWLEDGQPRSQAVALQVQGRSRQARHIRLPPRAEKALQSLGTEKPMLDIALRPTPGLPQWRGDFHLPLKGQLRERFGVARRYGNSDHISRHRGLDIAVPVGSSVTAANFGTVVLAAEHLAAYGGLVVIHHGYGLCSTYMHLSRVLVQSGQVVSKGECIALSGAEGIATGPHLHWQLNLNGFPIDPMPWIDRADRVSVK